MDKRYIKMWDKNRHWVVIDQNKFLCWVADFKYRKDAEDFIRIKNKETNAKPE